MNYEITKLNQEYIRRIKQNKDLLVEAFTLYYGEKYYKYIKEKIDNIIFFWYIPPKINEIYNYVLDQLILNRIDLTKEIIKSLGGNEDLKFMGNFSDFRWTIKGFVLDGYVTDVIGHRDYLPILKSLFGDKGFLDLDYEEMPIYQSPYANQGKIEKLALKLKKEEIYRILPALKDYCLGLNKKDTIKLENVLGTTNPKYLFNEENIRLNRVIQMSIDDSYAFQLFYSLKTNMVGFPILFMEDKEFIHEINHAVKNILFTDIQSDMVASKSGLSITINERRKSTYLEEIINDLEALDITNIFHSLGGSIFKEASLFGKEKCEDFQKYFPLVNDFYDNYLEVIKKASIGENLNYLFSQIDKDAYREYASFVEDTFKKRFKEELKEEDIREAKRLVRKLSLINLADYNVLGETKSGILRLKKKDKA